MATKYDSSDIASQVQAEALSSNTVLMTPGRVNDILADNGGMLQDIQALADPNADTLLGWDDSAGAVIGFTLGTGLAFSTNTVIFSFLGLEALTDPGADRIFFWDDSETASKFLSVTGGLEISATALQIADVAATTSNPIDIASGAFTLDLTALTTIEGSALAAGDLILVDDGGTPKAIKKEELGLATQTAQTSQTLAAADMNTIMEFNGTATLTIPTNASVDLPTGVPIILVVDHATQELTITADSGVTLNSVFHPGGADAASDVLQAGGTAVLFQSEDDQWYLSGDIADS